MEYTPEDELPHTPGTQPNWQESVWVQWYDRAAGVGGLHRIGQEVNRGKTNVVFALVTDEGTRFRRLIPELPLRAEDRSGRIGAGDGFHMTFDRGHPVLVQRQEEAEIELEFLDFHARFNLWNLRPKRGEELMKEAAAHHFEVGGRVTGTVRLGDKTLEIDGLGYRDHSWGPRDYQAWHSHRWVAGTFGPELSFSLITMEGARGEQIRTGYVVREGVPALAQEVDIIAYMEPDGVTHRGGWAAAKLPDGEEIRIECELVDGAVWGLHGFEGIDTICRATSGTLVGQADFEMSNNARGGSLPIRHAIGSAIADGISHR